MRNNVQLSSRSEVQRKLYANFGDLEMVEAREPLRLQPVRRDIVGAKVKDPSCCVFARCAHRQYGATRVLFWKTMAYVDLVSPGGARRIERFRLPGRVVEQIESFDKGKPFPEGFAFVLLPPSPSQTIAARRRSSREFRQTPHGSLLTAMHYAHRSLAQAQERKLIAEERLRKARARGRAKEIELARLRLRDTIASIERLGAKFGTARRKASRWMHPTRKQHSGAFNLKVRNGQGHYHLEVP